MITGILLSELTEYAKDSSASYPFLFSSLCSPIHARFKPCRRDVTSPRRGHSAQRRPLQRRARRVVLMNIPTTKKPFSVVTWAQRSG